MKRSWDVKVCQFCNWIQYDGFHKDLSWLDWFSSCVTFWTYGWYVDMYKLKTHVYLHMLVDV
jgi:hypothetical protein